MSVNLSDLLQKPYIGLTKAGSTLGFSLANPTVALTAGDTTPTGDGYPVLALTNSYQAVGAGPQVWLQARNSGGSAYNAATLKGSLNVLTAGSEAGKLVIGIAKAAAQSTLAFQDSGTLISFGPATNAQSISLGTPAGLNFNLLYLGNASQPLLTINPQDTANRASIVTTNNFITLSVGTGASQSKWLFWAGDHLEINPTIGNTGSASVLHVGDYKRSVAGILAVGITVATTFAPDATGAFSGVYVNPDWDTSAVLQAYFGMKIEAPATGFYTAGYGVWVNRVADTADVTGADIFAGSGGGPGPTAGSWCIWTGGDPAYLGRGVLCGDLAPTSDPNYILKVDSHLDSRSVFGVQSYSAAAPTHDLIAISAAAAGTTYNLLSATLPGPIVAFAVRGDGAILANTATPLNNAKATINGRIHIVTNDTYDLSANTLATSLVVQGTHTISGGNLVLGVWVSESVSLGAAASYSAMSVRPTITAADATSTQYVYDAVVSTAGGGFLHGNRTVILTSGTSTVSIRGMMLTINSVATVTQAYAVLLTYQGTLHGGVVLQADIAAAPLVNGFYINPNGLLLLTGSAFRYDQRAGATGDFLRYVDSSANIAFQVDSGGNVKMKGNQILTTRQTGWTAWTGTGSKATKLVSSATVADCAAAIKSLVDDLITHGLIGT